MINDIIRESDISDEEKEIALYGWKRLAILIVSIGASIIIGFMIGELLGVILFLAMFIPLRVFAGGLHMPKLWLCGIVSSLLIIFVALLIRYIEPEKMMAPEVLILCLTSAIIIVVLAPVDTECKHLFMHEKRKFKIISALIVLLEITVIFMFDVSLRVKMIAEISIMTECFYLIIQSLANLCVGRHKTSE